jgi:hypothetical protein
VVDLRAVLARVGGVVVIDKEQFTYWMACIADRTNRTEFWPAPRVFIDAIRPDLRLVGAQVFQWIQGSGHHNGQHAYWVAEEIEREYGAPALVAFRAIGGGERFANLSTSDQGFALKEFCDAYVRAKTDAAKPPAVWPARIETVVGSELPPNVRAGHLLRAGQPD